MFQPTINLFQLDKNDDSVLVKSICTQALETLVRQAKRLIAAPRLDEIEFAAKLVGDQPSIMM